MAILSDPLGARIVFGLILGLSVLSGWRSGNEALQKAGFWLVVDWVCASVAYELLTAQGAPWIAPAVSALVTVPLGGLAIRYKSFPVWSIIGLMVASLAVNLGAFIIHAQGGYLYYVALNVLFVLRASVLGGAGVLAARTRHRRAGASPRATG